MLNINKEKKGTACTYFLEGRLDTTTAPQLEGDIKESIEGVESLVMDLSKLEYISSAGLRVLLGAAQAMDGKGDMVVRNLNQSVREVFELTGFSNLFNIE